MQLWEAAVLGAVQGATEFLPVSSSGHLVLGRAMLGVDLGASSVAFDVAVHLGTLSAVVAIYLRDLAKLLTGFFGALKRSVSGDGLSALWADPGSRLALLVLLGTLPAVGVGLSLNDFFEGLFSKPEYAASALLVTAALLASTLARSAPREPGEIRPLDALLIGVAQALAITPGISRSGSTIAVALLLGVGREQAARFSFLLAVPAILGAAVLEARQLETGVAVAPLLLGAAAAAIVGVAALKALIFLVHRGKIAWFAPYCAAVGIVALILLGRGGGS